MLTIGKCYFWSYESCPSETCPNESFPKKVAQSERCPTVKDAQVWKMPKFYYFNIGYFSNSMCILGEYTSQN